MEEHYYISAFYKNIIQHKYIVHWKEISTKKNEKEEVGEKISLTQFSQPTELSVHYHMSSICKSQL